MEKQAELPKIWCVGVAVCAASYTFDRLFSYIAMQEIPAGCRVVVPFGKGNAKRVGIVLSCAEQAAQPEQQLKPVLAVVDKQPILSPEMLDLVFWLKEMTFCTYYDAVRTILPAGMQVQLVETISLAEPQPDCPLTDAEAHLLFFLRGAKTKQEFRRILADADTQGKKIVDTLVQKGFLLRQETVKEKTHGQTGIKMLRMAVPPDEVPPVTKTQQKLVRILQETGAVSEKEACYLSGVTTAVAKKLVQNGVVESYTVKPPLHTYAASGQTCQPADIVLSAEQQAVYDRMVAALGEGMHCFLLHGVTGSGKTSVFIRLIDTVVQRGKQVILNIFPSLDTGVCAASVRKFNKLAAELPGTVVLAVSKDLPFAHARFCTVEGIENVVPVSDFRKTSFDESYGVLMTDGPLKGLLARSVVVIDGDGKVVYTELVPEITQEPDYDKALAAVKR